MKKVAILSCGQYMDSGYGCPGEWRCYKAAALGEGKFDEPSQVVFWIACECPGKTVIPNTKMAMKLSEMKPEAIYMSTCMVGSFPGCPHYKPEEMAQKLQDTFGIPVIMGTHEYT
ncbi:CGGC domain-containing protein [Thermodesulforhabdus norvegica]|uniref:Predicted metal-binding protein n=1 Tax=Thermodesulforhabdus norvegica TaxID=39841 RepID=A0A1I4QK15_9BACT|nr:CGGC domain-containing protein [Thermodesulforhabdus norvegica]SFM40374.1 Predicted metal-binding protein [Thermodesulforhabdus norvegica]